jgi:hypothetical protein
LTGADTRTSAFTKAIVSGADGSKHRTLKRSRVRIRRTSSIRGPGISR